MVEGNGNWRLDGKIRERVISSVRPPGNDLEKILRASERLISRIGRIVQDMGLEEVEPRLAGSVAKGTIAGRPDIDIFILFPRDTYKEDMERWGMEIGKRVLEDPSKKYTQHPYLTGSFEGYAADIVPCLRIERGEKLETAVDRTPHHTEYILSKMNEKLREDAVLLKSFFKGIGVYGAEDVVRGFSGYICEILVLLHGGFDKVIKWFSAMDLIREPPSCLEEISSGHFMGERSEPQIFDSEDLVCEKPLSVKEYISMFKKDVLIVIDPVDPMRNVGSPVSEQTLAYTVSKAREMMRDPSEDLFSHVSARPHQHEVSISGERMDNLYSIPLPDGNPDIITTQARSFLMKSVKAMERLGEWKVRFEMAILFPPGWDIDKAFRKPRYTHYIDGMEGPRVVFRIRSHPPLLPEDRVHWGPPFNNKRAEDFMRKWGNNTRKDEASGKLFVRVKVSKRDPGDLFLEGWDDMKIGSLYSDTYPAPVENQLIHDVIRDSSGC